MRILVIEDDDRIRSDVQSALEAAGYIVDVEASGEEGWFLGDTETYGAVVLDLGLPQMDGLTVLKRWRKAGKTMPVLILTARGTWNERVDGIDAGQTTICRNRSMSKSCWPGCGRSYADQAETPDPSLQLARRNLMNVKCGCLCVVQQSTFRRRSTVWCHT